MSAIISGDSLMHAIQCVAAMSRFMEEFVYTPVASGEEKEAFGELICDMDTVLDNLTTVYDQLCKTDASLVPSEKLMDAFSSYTLQRKA